MRCPKCGREKGRLLALSREDNKTMICDDCGVTEALESFRRYLTKDTRKASPDKRTR